MALSKKSARSSSPRSSGRLLTVILKLSVSGAVVLVHHAEFLREAEKAFGVPDEEIAIGIQAVPELFDETLLLGFVEIDHDVAAEDEVVALRQKFGLQIVKVELDQFLELRLDGVVVGRLVEIAQAVGVVDRLHVCLG